MRILVVTLGSAGDVHPFVAVALALRERGHAVRFATNPHFAPLLERLGLPLRPIGTVEDFEEAMSHPGLWRPVRGLGVVTDLALRAVHDVYCLVEEEARSDTVVVSHSLAFGARVAHDALGVPLVTLHLAPAALWSIEAPAVAPTRMGSIERWQKIAKRLCFGLMDKLVDLKLGPGINELRASVGLAPVRHIASRWWHSPQRVVGLFPDWYAAPQPDWPPQAVLTGFPLYDEQGVTGLPAHLEAFLAEAVAAGDPPVAFAPGSSNRQAHRFFAAAADACRRLRRRGVLLTRYPEQLPGQLPSGVVHAEYAPFSALLPRVAALVHHGGIGTCAQALASGRPQLVMPMGFDQPDNAARLARLGVASALPPKRFTGASVARELGTLLGSNAVAGRSAELARRFEGIDPVSRTCDLIEECGR
ncbi:MAG: glycosyltransferase family 1 protein [Acidobacteriia bacterium]|nr:glycosyltransferase family 1 protein [Terriglobia bacterium]